MTTLAPPDDGIPVLTDIVTPEATPAATPAASALDHDAALEITQRLPALTRAEPAADADPASRASADAAGEDAEWLEALALRVQSRVLTGLTRRIDPMVEQRLRESLTDLLEQVLAGMTAELKVTARNIVRDAVAQAVAAELADLYESKQ